MLDSIYGSTQTVTVCSADPEILKLSVPKPGVKLLVVGGVKFRLPSIDKMDVACITAKVAGKLVVRTVTFKTYVLPSSFSFCRTYTAVYSRPLNENCENISIVKKVYTRVCIRNLCHEGNSS